jgi:hypothetical protein
MNSLISFATERVKSLVSKKVGAAVLAEGALTGTKYQGVPLIIYIICTAVLDAVKYYADAKFS